ncbi:hypothetical protein GCM10023328_28840 [Modestobacter marinus]|uniref:DUF2510 domain-containing protein n=1 Tax=Modestobacter marinus TaxID=477641 RepID=A0A846LMP5_9ACTN|nr:DUF2510 domain-containing protein [Modestobacter marinus]NIH67784.1 hypothetical protein [Modestobacter marinus]GGL71319.1 hypothetical protein GCM10011589_29560 [Modestobacter marinus]
MSGPGPGLAGPVGQGSAPAPGWYPDPDGAAELVRWWNGVTWSDVTTPAGPGVSVGRPFEAPPVQAPSSSWDSWESPEPARPRRSPLLLGLGGFLLVLVLVLAGLLVRGSGPAPEPAGQAPLTEAAPAPGREFPPGTVRIIDEAAGISYPFLGDGWLEWDRGVQLETVAVAGQYFVTQDDLPGAGEVFIAQCTSGPLVPSYGWSGPDTLQSTATAVADSVRTRYYPEPNERTVRRDEAVTVDGAPAWLVEFDLTWDAEGYDASGERAALLLVDVGRPALALLYLSIPNTHAELYGAIDRVLADVQVL